MKIRFIINPISGTGKQKGIEEFITKHLENFEIIYAAEIYIPVMKRLVEESRKKIKELTRNN